MSGEPRSQWGHEVLRLGTVKGSVKGSSLLLAYLAPDRDRVTGFEFFLRFDESNPYDSGPGIHWPSSF